MNASNNELLNLVNYSYILFNKYQFGNTLEVCNCDCCISEEDSKVLFASPLTNITPALIREYLNAASSENHFKLAQQIKFILPKILDFITQGIEVSLAPEFTLAKLHIDLPNAWEEDEIIFMRKFSSLFFQDKLFNFVESDISDSYMVMFVNSGLDVKHLFNIWENAIENYTPMLNFIQMLHYNFDSCFYYQSFADSKFIELMNNWVKTIINNEKFLTTFISLPDNLYFDKYYLYMYDNVYDKIIN